MALLTKFELDPDTLHQCDDCGTVASGRCLGQIRDFFKRVAPGGIVPSGECLTCGALCYPVKDGDNDGN